MENSIVPEHRAEERIAPRQERRRAIRVAVKARLYMIAPNGLWEGETRDLTMFGLQGTGFHDLQVDQVVDFVLHLPDGQRTNGVARVAWVNARGNFGLEFIELPNPDRLRVGEFLLTRLPWWHGILS